MVYTPIEQAAGKQHTTVESVKELVEKGLLEAVVKGGHTFVSSQDMYKLSFILYLRRERRLQLTEIEEILRTHRPPYTDWQNSANRAGR